MNNWQLNDIIRDCLMFQNSPLLLLDVETYNFPETTFTMIDDHCEDNCTKILPTPIPNTIHILSPILVQITDSVSCSKIWLITNWVQ